MGLEHLCGGEGQAPSGAPPAPSGDEGRADCTRPDKQGRPVPAGPGGIPRLLPTGALACGGQGGVESHQRTLCSQRVTVLPLRSGSWLGPGGRQPPESGTPGGQAAQREWTVSGPPCLGPG